MAFVTLKQLEDRERIVNRISQSSGGVARLGVAFAALALIGAACSGGTSSNESAELDEIRGAFFTGSFPNLPETVAQYHGFFEEEGIKYIPVTIDGGGAQQGAALASGDIDIAAQEVRAIIMAGSEGGDLRMVMGSTGASIYALVVLKDLDIPEAGDDWQATVEAMKGLNLGITSLGSGTDFLQNLLLKEAGLPEDHWTVIPIGAGSLSILAALEAGTIDAYMSFEPHTQFLVDRGTVKIVLDATQRQGPSIMKDYSYNGYVTTAKTAADREDVFKRFVTAMMKAMEFMRDPDNAEAVAEAFMSETEVPDEVSKDVIVRATRAAANTFWPIVDEGHYEFNVAMLDRLGILTRDRAPAYEDVILVNLMPKSFSPAN